MPWFTDASITVSRPRASIRGKYLILKPKPASTIANNLKIYFVRQPYKLHYGTAQAGAASTITLASSATAGTVETIDDYYNFAWVQTTGGTGAGQIRQISDYVGSTKVATVDTAWSVQPDNTTVYSTLPLNSGYNRPTVLGTAMDLLRKIPEDTTQREGFYVEAMDNLLASIKHKQNFSPRFVIPRGG